MIKIYFFLLLKFAGLIFLVNFILSFINGYIISNTLLKKGESQKRVNSLFLYSLLTVQLINLFAYIFFLYFAKSNLSIQEYNRVELLKLLPIIVLVSGLLVQISKQFKKGLDGKSENLEPSYSDIILGKTLTIGFGLVFISHLLFIVFPQLLNSII